jgi:hypothetical protein
MKKLIFLLLVLLLSIVGYSQNRAYLGPMNKELFDNLSVEERNLFIKCVKQTNISLDSMEWIQVNVKDTIYEKVRRDDGVNYYYNKKTIIYNSDNSNKIIDKFGKHNLVKPKFLVGIFKYPSGITRVTLMMFY